MEKNEISVHEVRAYLALKAAFPEWLTAKQISDRSGIAQRTGRAMALKLVRLGLLDVAELFPAHRYRLAEKAGKRNAAYMRRLEEAREVFGAEAGV